MSDALNTAEAVVDILGGTRAVAKLTGRSDPAVSNWRKANSFPANTYLTLKSALEEKGATAPYSLWGMGQSSELAS
jgi:hypothetical protein